MTQMEQLKLLPAAEIGAPPQPSDNGNHERSDDEWWQESALFTFVDQAAGFGCWLRFGEHANQGVANVYTWTSLGESFLDRRLVHDIALAPDHHAITDCAYADASVTTIEPLMRHALTLDRPGCKLRLEWRNFRTPLTMGYNIGGATIARGHYNAMGEAVGELEVAGRVIPIHAYGFSDHSWGVRRSHLPASRSLFAVFGDDLYFTAIPISTGKERSMVGYVYADGKLGRLETESALGYSFREDWVTPAGCNARVIDEHGRVFEFTGETFGPSSTWPMGHGKMVTHAPARFSCQGRTGSGILESAQFAAVPPSALTLGITPGSWWLGEH